MLDVLLRTDHNSAERIKKLSSWATAGALRFHTIWFKAKLMTVSR
jgi:hypothetical protein